MKLVKKSKLCIRFSQPHDFANGLDLIAQWCNRPAKLNMALPIEILRLSRLCGGECEIPGSRYGEDGVLFFIGRNTTPLVKGRDR